MKIPSELQKALTRAKAVLDGRKRIESEIEKAIAMQPGAEARLQDAMEQLGDAEADAILSGQSSQSGGAHEALNFARTAADALSARIGGLRRKLAEQDNEITAAHEALFPLRNEFTDKCIAEYRASFLQHAEKFMEIVRFGVGLSEGLGVSLNGLGVTKICDPTSLQAMQTFGEGNSSTDRTARGARDSVSEVRDQAVALEKLADDIQRARHQAAPQASLPARPPQPGVSGYYTGLSEAEWREAQLCAPRDPNVIVIYDPGRAA